MNGLCRISNYPKSQCRKHFTCASLLLMFLIFTTLQMTKVYHKGVAKKEPNEMSSFLTDYIRNVMNKDIRHLHVFSDSTGGQNNNTIVGLFLSKLNLVVLTPLFNIFQYAATPIYRLTEILV